MPSKILLIVIAMSSLNHVYAAPPDNHHEPDHQATLGDIFSLFLPDTKGIAKSVLSSVTGQVVAEGITRQTRDAVLTPTVTAPLQRPAEEGPKLVYAEQPKLDQVPLVASSTVLTSESPTQLSVTPYSSSTSISVPDEIHPPPDDPKVSILQGMYQKLIDRLQVLESKPAPVVQTETKGPVWKIAYEAQVPACVLYSIVQVESQWKPWSIGTTEPHVFKTHDEMISFARNEIDHGQKTVDIGFAQLNYLYHGDKFDHDLARMSNPSENLSYAARFMNQLSGTYTKWSDVAAAYHGASDPTETDRYVKLFKASMKRCDAVKLKQADEAYAESLFDVLPKGASRQLAPEIGVSDSSVTSKTIAKSQGQ